MRNKKKEILNSSLNVSRKKKKGLTPEEEEELRKKQASLFQTDQSSAMQPGEGANQHSTPTFQSSNNPNYSGMMYQPNEPKFYDGSITQVLGNPALNPSMAQNQQFAAQNPQASQAQANVGNVEAAGNQEEDKEEAINTNAQATLEASMPSMHGNQGKFSQDKKNTLKYLILSGNVSFQHKLFSLVTLNTVAKFRSYFEYRSLND